MTRLPRFKKRPVVVEAVKWTGRMREGVQQILQGKSFHLRDEELIIETLEGDMTASPGDWIIKGVSGECYPCKPDIFQETYERASYNEPLG